MIEIKGTKWKNQAAILMENESLRAVILPELGGKTAEHTLGESPYDFTGVPAVKPKSMVKYYVKGEVEEGCCGYEYPSQHMRCRLSYNEKILPYLGVWITAGGYRGDYNCAFEPSNGFYDSIEIARENGSLYQLKPGEPLEFDMVIEIEER